MQVKELFIYPIKSCRPLAVPSITISPNGVQYDRQFLLIRAPPAETDPGNVEHLTIKTFAELCLFQPVLSPSGDSILVHYTLAPASPPLLLPLSPALPPDAKTYAVSIFTTSTTGADMGAEAAAFFSAHLGFAVRLLYIGGDARDPHPRLTPLVPAPVQSLLGAWGLAAKRKEPHPQKIAYADVAPILVTTSSSLDDVTRRVRRAAAERRAARRGAEAGGKEAEKAEVGKAVEEAEGQEEMDITKFRPNIHVATPASMPAYDEEFWRRIRILPGAGCDAHSGSSGSESSSSASDDNSDSDYTDSSSSSPSSSSDSEGLELDCTFNTARCQSLNVDYATGKYAPGERQVYKLLMKDRRINPHFPYKPCFGKYAFAERGKLDGSAVVRVGDEVLVLERNVERHVEVPR